MNRFRIPERFSLISLLPWMLLALAIEQGPALSFYPDSNFSQQIELVEAASVEAPSSLSLESYQETYQGNATVPQSVYVAIPSSFIPAHSADFYSTSFIHQHVQRCLLSWIQSRSLPYQLC